MAKDQDNVRIYGGDDDGVWFAPPGTTLPTDLGPLDPDFEEIGLWSEDGMSAERQADVQEFRAHQGGGLVRKKVTTSGKTWTVSAIEDNEAVEDLGGDVLTRTTAGGVTTTTYSDAQRVEQRAMVIDLFDNNIQTRHVVSSVDVTASGTETWSNSAMTSREIVAAMTKGASYTKIVGPVPTP